MPFCCLVQICVSFCKEICLFPAVGVCSVSVEKPKGRLPGGWVPGNIPYQCPGRLWWHLGLVCHSRGMMILQFYKIKCFLYQARGIRNESSKSLSLRRWKFRPMPIHTSSEIANYYQLLFEFFLLSGYLFSQNWISSFHADQCAFLASELHQHSLALNQ